MVANFVSAEYGWLQSPDGQVSARILFKAGKNRDRYFTNEEILEHATKAMDILQCHYPHERHILIFDNATTHLKCAPGALSARNMSMKPTAEGKPMFGVEVHMTGEDGKPIYGPNGKILKQKVRMTDAKFANGSLQSLCSKAPRSYWRNVGSM
ncbi:hypothetical protein AcV5_010259 [Taiwanofungus camphoratus]|nr:hypothetical protein AcV5_010259 [Antrodia cinnamomea]